MNYRRKKAGYFLMVVAFVIVVAAVVTTIFMFLWNWLIPALFAGPLLTYWQALGLLVLAKIVFGIANHSKKWKGHHNGHSPWKSRCAEMTPEEKQRMKNHFMQRWCGHEHPESEGVTQPEETTEEK